MSEALRRCSSNPTSGPSSPSENSAGPGIGDSNAPHVSGPMMPSGTSPWLCWNAIVAARVNGPKMPSGTSGGAAPCPLSSSWASVTDSPVDPYRIIGLVDGSATAGASSASASVGASVSRPGSMSVSSASRCGPVADSSCASAALPAVRWSSRIAATRSGAGDGAGAVGVGPAGR
jgi:hypothetical protein